MSVDLPLNRLSLAGHIPARDARMNILLASAHPYIPQMIGGAQSSMHDLATEFVRRGHKVGVLSGLTGEGWVGRKSRVRLKLGRRNYVIDTSLGYPVYRAWFPREAAEDRHRELAPALQ